VPEIKGGQGWIRQKGRSSRPLERRLAFSHITIVQAVTSVSEVRNIRLHRVKARPDGGRVDCNSRSMED
jgi:hypothetical protein